MPSRVDRRTVDLTAYPDLVVIYLGMRVRAVAGVKTLLGLGLQIEKAGGARPEGLLHYENNIAARTRLRAPSEAPAQPAGVAENDLY